jgi:hypothetical protein
MTTTPDDPPISNIRECSSGSGGSARPPGAAPPNLGQQVIRDITRDARQGTAQALEGLRQVLDEKAARDEARRAADVVDADRIASRIDAARERSDAFLETRGTVEDPLADRARDRILAALENHRNAPVFEAWRRTPIPNRDEYNNAEAFLYRLRNCERDTRYASNQALWCSNAGRYLEEAGHLDGALALHYKGCALFYNASCIVLPNLLIKNRDSDGARAFLLYSPYCVEYRAEECWRTYRRLFPAPRPAAPTASAPAAPPRPAGVAVPGTSWVATGIRLHEGPPSGVAWAEQRYSQRFSRAALRNLFIGITFAGPAGVTIRTSVACGVTGPTGESWVNANVDIDPPHTGYALTLPGVGWAETGRWRLGRYQVECRNGGVTIGKTGFDVVQWASDGWIATNLRVFAAGESAPDLAQRQYATRFSRAILGWLYVQLDFDIAAGKPFDGELRCQVRGPDLDADLPMNVSPGPTWTGFASWNRTGSPEPNRWAVGRYDVTCRARGGSIATTSFEVVQSLSGWIVKSLEPFYWGGDPNAPRRYGPRFHWSELSWLAVEMGYERPAGSSLGGPILCTILGPDSLTGTLTLNPRPQSDWTSGVTVSDGWGWAVAGNWRPGQYQLRCALNGAVFATRSFEVLPQ